jgi:hypothetical protein
MKNLTLLFIAVFCISIATTQAQINCSNTFFNYQYFDIGNFAAVGNSRLFNEVASLTEAFNNQAGAVWYRNPFDASKNFSCSISFMFREGNNQSNFDGSLPGADGVALLISNEPFKSGFWGGGIGYSGLKRTIAIEVDSYRNIFESDDPNGNHLAVQVPPNKIDTISNRHNSTNTLLISDSIFVIKDYQMSYLYASFSAKDSTLEVTFDSIPNNFNSRNTYKIRSVNYSKYLDLDKPVYVGVSSATGVAFAKHYLHSFSTCATPFDLTSIDDDRHYEINKVSNNVYDILGRLIVSSNTKIDLNSLEKGFYLIESNGFFKKLIIE